MNGVTVAQTAIERIKELKTKPQNGNKFLRISVSGGGCSGFQYIYALEDNFVEGDIIIAQENETKLAVTDETSMQFLKDSEVQFIKELGASYFKIVNPNAASNCGCGSSFSV